MKDTTHYRQGDVLIELVDSIPSTAVLQPGGQRIILAHGEVTGHHHSIEADAADWWKDGDVQYVRLRKSRPLVHQEHDQIPLKRGQIARVTRQREYSPEAIRNVQD